MSKWKIIRKTLKGTERIVREYPFKMQAVIWCYMHGYVTSGGYGSGKFHSLDPKIKIVEVKNANK